MLLPFELDPQIIHHIIYSQAGSIGKALIELIMNSVDAKATTVRLTMTKTGFDCADDGTGFASREDVVRYFGRFGTPHQEGDATYGRFRLGRGQVMAHAKTEWVSNRWLMRVDTRAMGYSYELEDLQVPSTGCSITGTWYEALNDLELMSAMQEIRDLVRYTPISVELNGRVITRNPANEKWDFEDDWAYYRAKEEGPVSIYNQGVLIRHDSSHVWGAGGLIVSKKAISLNVSRTEILRTQAVEERGERAPWFWRGKVLDAPVLAAYATFRDAFIERTQIVDDRTSLDKETRRAWTALRWCLQHYAGACVGAERYRDGTLRYDEKRLQILLGESNTAEAWTDGQTYLAISCDVVRGLSSKPLETVAYIFGLVEHEVAHQGDSIACGHDEAFYQRYHDISIRMAPERQRFMHKWLMKYTMSMEREGQKARGRAWGERWLVDRVGSGRMKRGLSPVIEDVSTDPVVTQAVPEQSMALLRFINAGLVHTGACPEPPNWEAVRDQARIDQEALTEHARAAHEAQKAEDAEFARYIDGMFEDAAAEVVKILALDSAEIPAEALNYLASAMVSWGYSADDVKRAWTEKEWIEQHQEEYCHEDFDTAEPGDPEFEAAMEAEAERLMGDEKPIAGELWRVDEECRQFVQEGETFWLLERNAAAAGFYGVEAYLKWRSAENAPAE